MNFLKRLLSDEQDWTISVDGVEYTLHNLTKREFELFTAEYIEHGIKKTDLVAFAKRWIDEDAEYISVDGERVYPEAMDE